MAQNNVAGRVWPFASRPSLHALRAFTLAELLVSVSVLIILLGMVGVIYKSAAGAISQSNATTEIYQKAEALRRQLTQDIRGLTKEGYLYIAMQTYDNLQELGAGGDSAYTGLDDVRADIISFIAAGSFRTSDGADSSNLARITYLHAPNISPSTYGVSPDNDPTVNRWVLARRARLFIPGWPGGPNDPEVIDHSLGEEMKNLFTGTTLDMTDDMPDIDFPSNRDIRTYLAEYCGDFRVRYSVDGITWQDPDPPPGLGEILFIAETVPWPVALEFTVRLYDRNLRVTSYDDTLAIPKEHGGLTFKFVIPLPD